MASLHRLAPARLLRPLSGGASAVRHASAKPGSAGLDWSNLGFEARKVNGYVHFKWKVRRLAVAVALAAHARPRLTRAPPDSACARGAALRTVPGTRAASRPMAT
jgi:hypothetical protein